MTTSDPLVVDANVWIARVLTVDAFHVQSRAWLNARLRTRAEILDPVLILSEVAGAVARISGDSTLAHGVISDIRQLRSVRLIDLDQGLGEEAARLAADLRLRGADASYVAVALRFRVPLVSWD